MLTHTVAATQELYQQMLPTKLPPKGNWKRNFKCHMPNVHWRGVGHSLILSISRGITQLLNLVLGDAEAPGTYFRSASMVFKDPTQPSYENGSAQALWDVPVYGR